MAWILPETPLNATMPPIPATEKEKFDNNCEYFAQKARYWIDTKFNQPIRKFFDDDEDLNKGSYANVRVNTFIRKCMKYYYGEQAPWSFNFESAIAAGATTTTPYIPGGDIRPLADFMIGNVIQTIKPLRRSISAIALSRDVIDRKTEYFNLLRMKRDLGDKIKQMEAMGAGLEPPNAEHKSLQDEGEIEKAMSKFKDEYEKIGINISKSIYFMQDLHNKFIELASQQIIGGISQVMVTGEDGDVVDRILPCWSALHDDNATDIFGTDKRVGGGVMWYTPQEIMHMHPEMDDDTRKWLMSIVSDESVAEREYINQSGQGCASEWVTADGLVSYAVVMWKEDRDTRYAVKDNPYGIGEEYFKINDGDNEVNIGGKVIRFKGDQVKGKIVPDIHKVILVGNTKVIAAGYADYVVRDKKGNPQIPIISLCHGFRNGYFKSVVGRLIPLQEELDYVSDKIRKVMARDKGKTYIFDGSKLTVKARKLLEDLESMGIHVTNSVSGEVDDPNDRRPLVTVADFSLDKSIMDYLSIKARLVNEMQSFVSIPDVALGQQQKIIGKGVQENTITQATLGQMSIYEAINEFFQKVLQMNLDVAKMVYTDTEEDTIERVMPISQDQVYLLKITKDFRAEDIGVYILPNDAVEGARLEMLRSFIQAISQNIQYLREWGLGPDDVFALMRIETFEEGIQYIQTARQKNLKMIAQQDQAKTQMETDAEIQKGQSKVKDEAMLQLLKDQSANYRAEVAAMSKYLSDLLAHMQQDKPPGSPLASQFGVSQQLPPMPPAQDQAAA